MIRTQNKKLPAHCRDFLIYIELFCVETNYKFKKCVNFANTHKYWVQWYPFAISLQRLKDDGYTQLNFGCFVEILNVKYQTEKLIFRVFKQLTIYDEYRYKWRLNEDEYKLLMKGDIDSSLYSYNFNGGCFCILLIPFGWSFKNATHNHLFAKIKLVKLPWSIKQMDIETDWIVKCKKISVGWKWMTTVSVKQCGDLDEEMKVKTEEFMNQEFLEIVVNIKILKIYDEQDQQIEKRKWIDHAIVSL